MNEFTVGDSVVDSNGFFGIVECRCLRLRKSGVCGSDLSFKTVSCVARDLLGRRDEREE